jgi:uncharacterized protein (DUF433 family)
LAPVFGAILLRAPCETGADAMSELHRVTFDPAVCAGRPCLRGLRIRVRDILDLLAVGASSSEIVADYPDLEAEDITAALEYATCDARPRPFSDEGQLPPIPSC